MDHQANREFARAVVKRVSPHELPLFDDIWADLQQDDSLPIDRADANEREIGFGGAEDESGLLSTLLVPILASLGVAPLARAPGAVAETVVARLRQCAEQRKRPLEQELERRVEQAVTEAIKAMEGFR